MPTGERLNLKAMGSSAGYLLIGALGTIALTLPLFGALGYLASPLLPLLLGWFGGGAILALIRSGRLAQIYLFGNFGALAGTLGVFVGVWIRLALTGEEPNPAVAAPLYLALVFAGLGLGIVVGARLRIPQA
jgi:hypothetical protein